MSSLRNTVILSSLAVMAIIGGIVFYAGKTGSISANSDNKNCKFYAFTDHKSYSKNSTVSFGLKNDKYSKCTLKIREDLGSWSITDLSNRQVYKASSTSPTISNLKPGDRLDWKWNMRSNIGTTIPAGKYKIKFTSIEKEVEFSIQ